MEADRVAVGRAAVPSNSMRPRTRAPDLIVTATSLTSRSARDTGVSVHQVGSSGMAAREDPPEMTVTPPRPPLTWTAEVPNALVAWGRGTSKARIAYCPGVTPRNANRPEPSVVVTPISGSADVEFISALTSRSVRLATGPLGPDAMPEIFDAGVGRKRKSTAERVSPDPTVTTPARLSVVLPAKYCVSNTSGRP